MHCQALESSPYMMTIWISRPVSTLKLPNPCQQFFTLAKNHVRRHYGSIKLSSPNRIFYTCRCENPRDCPAFFHIRSSKLYIDYEHDFIFVDSEDCSSAISQLLNIQIPLEQRPRVQNLALSFRT